MAIIQPKPSSLREILRGKKYKVPYYQRTYSWSIDEANELWNDINENDPPYFLGILLLKEGSYSDKTLEIVDGQQRLATLMLMLRAAVDVLGDHPEGKRISEHYIDQQEVGQVKSDFTLNLNYRDNDRFHTLISDSKHTFLPPKGIRRASSWKNLDDVKEYFVHQFNDLKDKKGPDGIINFVVRRILELTLLDVRLEEDSDVYLFFETLNDRGMDLSLIDLIKNRICNVSSDPQVSATKVDGIADKLGSGKIKSFLLYYCWASTDQNPPPPRKKLMDWYRDTIKNEEDQFLRNLLEYADRYHEFIEPSKISNTQLRKTLTYIDALGATRGYPVLLAAYDLPNKDFLRLCNAIELLTVRYTTIGKKDSKNLEAMYQSVVKLIRQGAPMDEIIQILKNKASEVSEKYFQATLEEYEPENDKIAKYILLKIDNYLEGESSEDYDFDSLTLEHIIPKSSDEELKRRLGNMTLLSGPKNMKLGNKPFNIKVLEYAKSRISLTKQLTKYTEFTKESIIKQQEYFGSLAKIVWDPSNIK